MTPKGRTTRPTADRARQGLFDWLGPWLNDARVLDLFAGSGALGIEALSRGAQRAVFVESSAPAVAALNRNIDSLGLRLRARALGCRVEQAKLTLQQEGPFDLIFCDPPWANLSRALSHVARLLVDANLIAEGGAVAIEHPASVEPELEPLVSVARRTWGGTGVSLFTRGGS